MILQNPEDVISEISQTAVFKIVVKKSHVATKVDMYREEKIVRIDSVKYLMESTETETELVYVFTVNNLTVQDAGKITFSVSNTFGKTTASALLYVKCKRNI